MKIRILVLAAVALFLAAFAADPRPEGTARLIDGEGPGPTAAPAHLP